VAIVNASVRQQRNQADVPATPERPADGGISYDKSWYLAEAEAATNAPGQHRPGGASTGGGAK